VSVGAWSFAALGFGKFSVVLSFLESDLLIAVVVSGEALQRK
jgi:hypothetical protein